MKEDLLSIGSHDRIVQWDEFRAGLL
jgi:hypothetical protein